MRLHALAVTCLLCIAAPATEAGPDTGSGARFPAELHGAWDAYPLPCSSDDPSDSDTRIRIEAGVLHGFENNDAIRSIERIAEAPSTWRIVTISDIAPAAIQGEADIYVMRGHALTITNGERTSTYIRCR